MKRRRNLNLVATAAAVLLSGCGGGEATISDRAEDPCLQAIPACPGVFAQCVLDPSRYGRVRFPGTFRFLADIDAGFRLVVHLLFAEQREPGEDTTIFWNEPGCTNLQLYESEGANLFFESEDRGTFSKAKIMQKSGEHLVEIISDMQADTLITVDFEFVN